MKRVVANIQKEFRHVLNLNKQKEVNFKFNELPNNVAKSYYNLASIN